MMKRSVWILGLLAPVVGHATSFSLFDGAVSGSFDSQLTYGVAWRVGGPDNNPGDPGSVNFEDGDVVSNRVRGVHELGLTWANMGAFFRGNYYYDHANDNKDLARANPLLIDGDRADRRAIDDVSLLDAYVYGSFGPVTVRVGKQVISWGESTFIGGSINDINTVDVSQLRAPGSELKEALQPNEALSLQWVATNNLSFEGFMLTDFDEVILDPAGTFWNTAHFVADGGIALAPGVPRIKDDYAPDSGQWGVNAHYFAPALGSGYDFGVYYLRVHSHAPFINTPGPVYQLVYPEGVEIYGLSFNTLVGSWAVGGEWSHRPALPVQGAIFPAFFVAGDIKQDQVQLTGQLQKIPRFLDHVPLIPTADNSNLIVEVAMGWTDNVPATAMNPITDDYWGFNVNFTMDYLRAIAEVINLQPRIAFSWDVNGQSGENNFIEDEKAYTIGVNWDYLVNLRGGVSYTHTIHGNERRWIETNVSYQF